MASKRPNIIIINPDEMRADVMSHLGCEAIETKYSDALAEDGMSFDNAYCQNPVCVPSRCSFMSGWYPHVAGHRTMASMMQRHEPVLLRELKQNGYHVWMNSRNDLFPAQDKGVFQDACTTYFIPDHIPEADAFERWRGAPDGEDYYGFLRGRIKPQRDLDQLWVDGAVDFIQQYDEDRPFCLFLPLFFPHPPYQIWEPYYSRVDRLKMKKCIAPPEEYVGKCAMMKALHREMRLDRWNDEKFEELRVVYLGMCLRVDDLIGQVVNALKEKGIYDDSAVFVFSDHGDFAGDYAMVEKQQNSFEDCLTRVPFIVKLPGNMQQRHGVCSAMTELVDFYATAAELAQLPPSHTHFGKSLIPFARNQTDHIRDFVICEGGFRIGEDQCRQSETRKLPAKSHKYYPRIALQMGEQMYNGKGIMIRTREYKYVHRLYESHELYDLKSDPDEVHNVIGDPAYRAVVMQMRELLLTHYLDTSDAVPFQLDARSDPYFVPTIVKNVLNRPFTALRRKNNRG